MKACLNQDIVGTTINEVNLFSAMYKVFKRNYKCTLIEKTHQQQVFFKSEIITIPDRIRREISDLWIISYSPKRNEARMTFLQAKFEKTKRPELFSCFKFKGEFFQHELLSKRPTIENTTTNKFPKDVLSFTNFNSIGTFGVFYYDDKNDIDFAYCIASDIVCKTKASKNKQTTRALAFPYLPQNYYKLLVRNTNENELCESLSIDIFEYGILNLLVGAPIQNEKQILTFLKEYFQNKRADPVIADFLKFLDRFELPIEDSVRNLNGNTSRILLINVDEILY